MPLINLQTNLKSLRFEGRPPYIVKDIENPPVYNSLNHQVVARQDDVSRLAQMLLDGPGIKFAAHQALLQSSDPNNYKTNRTSVIGRVASAFTNIAVNTGKAGITALAQAGVLGTGTRFTLPLPEYYYTGNRTGGEQSVVNSTIVRDRQTDTVYSSRTSRYSNILESNNLPGFKGLTGANATNTDLTDNSYIVGPASDLREIGASTTTDANTQAAGGVPITIKRYVSSQTGVTESPLDTNFGMAGKGSKDRVNLFDIGGGKDTDDLVPLMFAKYINGSEYEGLKLFRGYIGTISDSFNSNWSANQYIGRMEQFFVYTGFTRTLSFPFTIPVFSADEQLTVYNKVNSLVSHTAPEYTNTSGIPSGVITYLKIGDYIQTPGVLNSVNVSVTNDVPWSYGNSKIGTRTVMLPQVLQLQIQFTPIHETTPQFDISTIDAKRKAKDKFKYIGNVDTFTDPNADPYGIKNAHPPGRPELPDVNFGFTRPSVGAGRGTQGIVEAGDGFFADIDNQFTSL